MTLNFLRRNPAEPADALRWPDGSPIDLAAPVTLVTKADWDDWYNEWYFTPGSVVATNPPAGRAAVEYRDPFSNFVRCEWFDVGQLQKREGKAAT